KKIEMKFREAIAFGIGFGGSEAIFLGILSFLNVLNLIFTNSYEDPSILFAPIIERLFVLFSHIFSCVLVIYSVKTKKIRYFLYSIIYKSPIDGIIPRM
ncbi:MAG TPA: YhfC family intramembrane metalloprotease, partial [Euryarchaeota archaeon]|nr:YhfC family intramembrane metalloprotease [Euryarchaeota archaeon]